jgi:hypothetical protein
LIGVTSLVVSLLIFANSSYAAEPARLIKAAEFGAVKEILGAARLLAQPRTDCPDIALAFEGGPCFDKIIARLKSTGEVKARVLGLVRPSSVGSTIRGTYDNGFTLYDVSLKADYFTAVAVSLPTSDVYVPKNCYALPGEGVTYLYEVRDGLDVAQEKQLVVCDGAPTKLNGPYLPTGSLPETPPSIGMSAKINGPIWPKTETFIAEGAWRYLAHPDEECYPQYLLAEGYCARKAITLMQIEPNRKEMDLIISKTVVGDGQVLEASDIEQMVLKRRKDSFKADKRWQAQSELTIPQDCVAIETVTWRVRKQADDYFINEQALSQCGPPAPPIPYSIYEAYAEPIPIATPSESCPDGARLFGNRVCFDRVMALMASRAQKEMDVLILDYVPREGDYIFEKYSLTTVRYSLPNGFVAEGRSHGWGGGVDLKGCKALDNEPPESKGYQVFQRGRNLMAKPYQWKSCPVY